MKTKTEIRVSTHVARDFLQSAAYFNTVPKVVWEYVSNSLDNSPQRRTASKRRSSDTWLYDSSC